MNSATSCVGRSAVHFVALLCLGGCQSHQEPGIELRSILLETPSGDYRFGASDVGDRVHIQFPSLAIDVRTPVVDVTVAPFGQSASVRVAPKPQYRSVQFESLGAFYQRDGGTEVPLSGTQVEVRTAGGEWFGSQWRVNLSPPLSQIALTSSRPPPYMIDAIESIEGEILRFYIPFRIEDEPYTLDISFELDLERIWSLGSIGGLP